MAHVLLELLYLPSSKLLLLEGTWSEQASPNPASNDLLKGGSLFFDIESVGLPGSTEGYLLPSSNGPHELRPSYAYQDQE